MNDIRISFNKQELFEFIEPLYMAEMLYQKTKKNMNFEAKTERFTLNNVNDELELSKSVDLDNSNSCKAMNINGK